jgi:hypothetical protein
MVDNAGKPERRARYSERVDRALALAARAFREVCAALAAGWSNPLLDELTSEVIGLHCTAGIGWPSAED